MLFSLLQIACTSTPLQEGYTEQGSYYVQFESNPAPIPFNEYFDIQVGVYANKDMSALLTDLDVIVDASMPAHQHGMNETPTQIITDEGYILSENLKWFMVGEWQLEFYITGKNGQTETAFFLLECCTE